MQDTDYTTTELKVKKALDLRALRKSQAEQAALAPRNRKERRAREKAMRRQAKR